MTEKKTKKEKGLMKVEENFPVLFQDANELVELIEANLGEEKLTQFDLNQIPMPGIKQKNFEYEDVTGENISVANITGIIIHHRDGRQYYQSADVSNQPPDCWSEDGISGFGIRAEGQKEPNHMLCAECPLSQFGSSLKGTRKGSACSPRKFIFVLQENATIPDVINAPPTSLKAFKQYRTLLVRSGKMIHTIFTKIGHELDKNSAGTDYKKLTFNFVQELEGETLSKAKLYTTILKPKLSSMSVKPDTNPDASE